MTRFRTHDVENQPPPLAPYDAWATDVALREAVDREGGGWAGDAIGAYGALAGGELMELARAANAHRPVLAAFDRYGHRIDEVEFHPAYHALMRTAVQHGVAGFAWRHGDRAGAHVARAALMYLHNQADAGTSCPLTMTYACVPALRRDAEVAAFWGPKIADGVYDPRHVPADAKRGVTLGMGMTEKQGGSDVRANTTRATPLPGGDYALVGHKWFFSAPMSDAFLVLAQAPGGLTCFLLPRILPDGSRNGLRLQRLKDKLGDWSNASSEVEFHDARATRLGDEGRGVATILQMVALTRLDCLLGSASLMRQALVQATHHARHRRAFGTRLVEQPLMRAVLADLALDSEAATALAFRVARAVDASARDPREAALARIATALGKFHVCKQAPAIVAEPLESLVGVRNVEVTGMQRLYREAQLNSGKAAATSSASTCCARSAASRTAPMRCSRNSTRCAAPIPGSTTRCAGCVPGWPPVRPKATRAISPDGSRPRCRRPRCRAATRRSPRPSSPRGSAAVVPAPPACSRAAPR